MATLQWGKFVYLGRVCKCGESSVIHSNLIIFSWLIIYKNMDKPLSSTHLKYGGFGLIAMAYTGKQKLVILKSLEHLSRFITLSLLL